VIVENCVSKVLPDFLHRNNHITEFKLESHITLEGIALQGA
jgi:hypothetical protein